MATPTYASAAGWFESVYACQAMATRKIPSPNNETAMPIHKRRNPRRRNGETSGIGLALHNVTVMFAASEIG